MPVKAPSTLSAAQGSEVKLLLDYVCIRSLHYRDKHDASQCEKRLNADLDQLSAKSDYISDTKVVKSKRDAARKKIEKVKKDIEGVDEKLPSLVLTLLGKYGNQYVSAEQFESRMRNFQEAIEASMNNQIQKRITEHETKFKTQHESEKSELLAQVGDEISKMSKQLEENFSHRLMKESSESKQLVDDLTSRLAEETSKNKNLEESFTRLDEEISKSKQLLENIHCMLKKETSERQQLEKKLQSLTQDLEDTRQPKYDIDMPDIHKLRKTVDTQLERIRAVESYQARQSRESAPRDNNTAGGAITQEYLDDRLYTTNKHLTKDITLVEGRLNLVEEKLKLQGVSLEALARGPPFQSQSHSAKSNTATSELEARILTEVEEKIKQKFTTLTMNVGAKINEWRNSGEKSTQERFRLLRDSLTTIENDVGKLKADCGSNHEQLDSAIQAQGQKFESLSNCVDEKITIYREKFAEFELRISSINEQHVGLQNPEAVRQIVAHINNSIPNGMQVQVTDLSRRLTTIEHRVHDGEQESAKRRKVSNGSFMPANRNVD